MPNYRALAQRISSVLKDPDSPYIAYYSTTPTSTPIAFRDDIDGGYSRVSTPSYKEIQLALLNESFNVSGETYSVSVYSSSEPSSNAVFWLSKDRGETKKRAKLINKVQGVQGAFYKLMLQVEA